MSVKDYKEYTFSKVYIILSVVLDELKTIVHTCI